MTRLWSHIALAALAGFAFFVYGTEQRKRGAAEAQSARWKAVADSLRVARARVDTIYRVQRDTFYVRRVRLDTLTLTVDRWKHDTVKVVEYVRQADSTVKSCSVLVVTCEERVANRDADLLNWQRRWDSREKPPSELRKWGERIGSALIGYGLGKLAP